MEVAAAGGMPHELAMSQREKGLRGRGGFPAGVQMLTAPNGDRLALTAMFSFEGDQIILQNIDRDETHILVEGVDAVYSATGHVLFRPSRNVREIWAVPISLDTLEPTGDTFRIAQAESDQPCPTTDARLHRRRRHSCSSPSLARSRWRGSRRCRSAAAGDA